MIIEQKNSFKRAYKKMHSNERAFVNDAIDAVIKNPNIGEKKSGDLSWLYVYKFKIFNQLTLLGYSITEYNEIILTFVDVGSHENFYRDLKN